MPINVDANSLLPGEAPNISLGDNANYGFGDSALGSVMRQPRLAYEDTWQKGGGDLDLGGFTYNELKSIWGNSGQGGDMGMSLAGSAGLSKSAAASWGSFDLNLVDPLGSLGNFNNTIGGFGQNNDPDGQSVFDSGLNALGTWPSRWLDYIYSTPAGWISAASGQNFLAGAANPTQNGKTLYRFQKDPRYWQAIGSLTDEQLRTMADTTARQVSNYTTIFSDQLYQVMKADQNAVTGQSSGDEHIDYIAKRYLSWVMDLTRNGVKGGSDFNLGPIKGNTGIDLSAFTSLNQGSTAAWGGLARMTIDEAITQLPFIGTGSAKALDDFLGMIPGMGGKSVPDDVEAMWQKLSPKDRSALLQAAGYSSLGTNIVVTWPLLSGFGQALKVVATGANVAHSGEAAIQVARAAVAPMFKTSQATIALMEGSGTAAASIAAKSAGWVEEMSQIGKLGLFNLGVKAPWVWRGYENTLHVAGILAGAGFVAWGSNLALKMASPMIYPLVQPLEAVPGVNIVKAYAKDGLGDRIDNSQPVSSSYLAGYVDTIGSFTGIFGANQVIGWVKHSNGGLWKPVFGSQEHRVLMSHFDGSQGFNRVASAVKIPDGLVDGKVTYSSPGRNFFNSTKANTVLSVIRNWVRDRHMAEAERMVRGDHIATRDLEQVARVEYANNYLREFVSGTAAETEVGKLLNVINSGRAPRSLIETITMSDAESRQLDALSKSVRELDDQLAQYLSNKQGAEYWTRQLNHVGLTYSVAGLKAYVKRIADHLGWEYDEAALAKSTANTVEAWQQNANIFAAREYEANEAAIQAAITKVPHAPDYYIIRGNDLTREKIADLQASIDQLQASKAPLAEGAEAVVPLRSEEELNTLIGKLIRSSDRADAWYHRYSGAAKVGVPPDAIASSGFLKSFREWLDHELPMSPSTHPWNVEGETANLPINSLARKLHDEGGHYAIAYKTKRMLVAEKEIAEEQAVRVSKLPPDDYTMNPADVLTFVRNAQASGAQEIELLWDHLKPTGFWHTTVAKDKVLAEGLKSSGQLREEALARHIKEADKLTDSLLAEEPVPPVPGDIHRAVDYLLANEPIAGTLGGDYYLTHWDVSRAYKQLGLPADDFIKDWTAFEDRSVNLYLRAMRSVDAAPTVYMAGTPDAQIILSNSTLRKVQAEFDRLSTESLGPGESHASNYMAFEEVWNSPALAKALDQLGYSASEGKVINEGLGAGWDDNMNDHIATSIDADAADMIYNHSRAYVAAANGKTTAREIVEAFWPDYQKAYTNPGTTSMTPEEFAFSRLRTGLGEDPYAVAPEDYRMKTMDDVIREVSTITTPRAMFELVKMLEEGLPPEMRAGFYSTFENATRIPLDQVAQLRLAVRRDAKDFIAGLDTSSGEIDMLPSDVWIVDHQARADFAGQRQIARTEPLGEGQPWAVPQQDVSQPDAGSYTYVHKVRYRVKDEATGEAQDVMLDGPHLDYPLAADHVALGNRTMLGRKLDDVFMGWRTWKMGQYQTAQAQRIFTGTYHGITAGQVDTFIRKVRELAEEEWSPLGRTTGELNAAGKPQMRYFGAVPLPAQATAILRSKEVQTIGEEIFGKGKKTNAVTGASETPLYANMLADSFRQSFKLNLTAGVTSRIYSMTPYGIGTVATALGQWFVPVLRYKASPIFRVSEYLESVMLNKGRGVKTTEDQRAAYAATGSHPRDTELASMTSEDPLAQGLIAGPVKAEAHDDELIDLAAVDGGEKAAKLLRDRLSVTERGANLMKNMWSPNQSKAAATFELSAKLFNEDIVGVIKIADPEAYAIMSKGLKVPDSELASWYVRDRQLYQMWQDGRIDLETLTAHASKYNPSFADTPEVAATMKAIYATEDWQALDGLLKIAADSAQAEAFGVHYFGSYRSPLERSVNHPVLGVYPASWAYKAAKEWARFLYANRTFGDGTLRLGSAPAVALSNVTNQMAIYAAQNGIEENWASAGPAAPWFFMFNLLLPGDWTSIPFPLSRSIRTVIRGISGKQDLNPVQIASDNLFGPQGKGGIGVIRDTNLFWQGAQGMYQWVTNGGFTPGSDQYENIIHGFTANGDKPRKPVDWDQLTKYPYQP